MCLVIFAHRCQPDLPLVLAANRDEFYQRPTEPAGFWPDQPSLLAGRDLAQGGTWMGITRSGRFAAITNYRDPARAAPGPRSRGELTLEFLRGDSDPAAYLAGVAERADAYAGFNLLLGAGDELWYYSNSLDRATTNPRPLAPGIYGLSNALLDTPWPKVSLGKQRLGQLLAGAPPEHAGLLEVVADRSLSDPEDLHPLGLDQEMDQLLSAQFITAADYGYGTRSSTTLWVDGEGRVHWREVSFDAAGQQTHAGEETFPIAAG